ncbi:protein FAM83H [Trichomycterus rosablanca]|uniref:protein FAM83H n=1 Tax=Trichomycterus rosablanca TaxID=2290929 RepID=UPI002F35D60C
MAHRSQCSSVGENPLDPNYLPPHYREEYRLAIDALVENDLDGYYKFLQDANVVEFLSKPEIEHIKNSLHLPQSVGSLPELPYHEVNDEGSSDTYWPLHSDLDAPGLDLGWPLQQHCFIGPTEVTTLVNPSDPEMPSIKEQARRLIKNAQQVIAVVMDMFTDVDIFNDLLQAAERHVPIYILLDEQNAHHFAAMVASCKVNLDMVHMMRVRTVAGITYFCRTGKSFKGQLMDRFLLVDCRAVLSGNYSFMWSFEKIHRCLAHMFSGELVASFDEEFRILFAQSQPLVVENALVPVPSDSSSGYISNQFGLKRSQSQRNPQGFRRQTELMAYPFGDRNESAMPFKRDDPFRHTVEPGGALHVSKFASQQFRMQQSFLEPGRPLASRQLDMNTYKRHSYAEGTCESYSSSRQYMKQRVMNNLEEMEAHFQRDQQFYHSEGMGPETGHGRFDPLRSSVPHQLDRYSDHMYQPELEAPVSQNVLSSDDLGHDLESKHHQGGGHFAQPSQKRPSVGQAYTCLNSPTHPQDHKQMFTGGEQGRSTQDPSVKQGLRSWRINSYLSAFENAGEEGLQQPLGPDAFDEPHQPEIRAKYPEASGLSFNTQEITNTQSKHKIDFRPRYGKPILPDRDLEKLIGSEQTSARKALTSTEPENEKEKDSNIPKDISITKHESFRSKINPLLQRSSRLRSSLIFSSSKVEQHSSTTLQEDEDSKPIKKSSIVAEILEKRRSFSREPFDWNKHKKTEEKDRNAPAQELLKPVTSKPEDTKEVTSKPEDTSKTTSAMDTKDIKVESINPVPEKQDLQPEAKPTTPSLTLTDPASRLQYFNELSQKRRESKSDLEFFTFNKSQEPQPKKPDITENPSSSATTVSSVDITITEPISTTIPADSATKPSVLISNSQPSDSSVLTDESTDATKKDTAKEPPRPTKPLPSPKFFKRDALKPFKSPNQRRISCGDDILTDATDAEKSEFKKSRSFSTSGMTRSESKESLNLSRQGSSMSLNVTEGKDTKPLDFFKKHTQKLKGILAPKGEKKNAAASVTAKDEQMKTVPEVAEEPPTNVKETNADLTSASTKNSKSTNKPSQSRYQSSTSNVLFSSNLRDDTKVILEQISANRQELTKQAEETGSAEGGKGGHVSNLDREPFQRYQTRNRFTRAPPNPQERDTLLKRIESMRKEKKVYSLFEIGNNLG